MAATLPPGERLVRCLTGGDIDRVPFGVNLGFHPWGDTLERWRRASGIADLDVARYFGYDPSFESPPVPWGLFPAFTREVLEEDAEYFVTRNPRGLVLRERRDGGSMPQFLSHPASTRDAWERLRAERLRLDSMDARVAGVDWDAFRARIRKTGEAVQVGGFPYGAFGTPRDLMGAEEVLVAFCLEPDLVRDIMNHMTSLWLAIWERVAARIHIDHIHIWEDMSGRQGSLISPAMVESFMMPAYDRITAFARAHDVPLVSVDTDGDCRELLPIFERHGVNVVFPFEVQAGCDILAIRGRHPNLGMMCGLDKRCLAGTLADVDAEMERAVAMLRHARYVPGFDHLIPPDAKWENFCHAAQRLRDICHGRSGTCP